MEAQEVNLSEGRLIFHPVALDPDSIVVDNTTIPPHSIFVDSTTMPWGTISVTETVPTWSVNNKVSDHNLFLSKLYLEFNDILDCEISHPTYQDTVREIISRVIEIYDEIHNS